MTLYAEVIGDPVNHSLSPAIHNQWLRELGLAAEYHAFRVTPAKLPSYLAHRREDPDWVGCNVTAPLKQLVVDQLDGLGSEETVYGVGAVNCVHRDRWRRLIGANTDIDGIAVALAGAPVRGARTVVIGAGGAAAALHWWLGTRGGETIILARDPASVAAPYRAVVKSFAEAGSAFADARLIVNATPMGLAGGPEVSAALLTALHRAPANAWIMDMVYSPLETPLLKAARARGLRTVDGLHMLIGQARRAFQLFFGVEPPTDDAALREKLIRAG